MSTPAISIPQKKVSILLLLGIIFMPIIFVWFLIDKGYSDRARKYGLGWLFVFILWAIFKDRPSPPIKNQVVPSQGAAVSKPVEINPIVQDTQSIEQIEKHIKDNKESLKKYYASADSLIQATTDIIQLAMIKSKYSKNDKSAEGKALGKRASKIFPQLEQLNRTMYASSIENSFMKNGLDIQVSAAGKEVKQLRIVYALMSQPLVYKFQNDMKIDKQASMMGFSKIVYTNGFESSLGETWTKDL